MIVCFCTVAVVIGIRWPIWLSFKGGRGNTAGMSAFALISFPALMITLGIWSLARMLLNNSFHATRVTLLFLPLIIAVVTHSWWMTLAAFALSMVYLNAQDPRSDDHQIIKQHWPSFWKFLTCPSRKNS